MKLTEKEKHVGRALEKLLYAEYAFTDVEVADILGEVGNSMSLNEVKGVLGSLAKKGISLHEEAEVNDVPHEFISMAPEYHKYWSVDAGVDYISLWPEEPKL